MRAAVWHGRRDVDIDVPNRPVTRRERANPPRARDSWRVRLSGRRKGGSVTREVVYEALCSVVNAGDIAYATDVAAALRNAGYSDVDDGEISQLLELLVEDGEVTAVPIDQPDGRESRDTCGVPQNSL